MPSVQVKREDAKDVLSQMSKKGNHNHLRSNLDSFLRKHRNGENGRHGGILRMPNGLYHRLRHAGYFQNKEEPANV